MIRAVIDTSVLIRYLIKAGAVIKELIEELWLCQRSQGDRLPRRVASHIQDRLIL